MSLADKHGITLNSSIHSYPSQCGSQLSFMGKVGPRVACSSSHSPSSFPDLGSTGGGFVGFLICQSVSALLHSGVTITPGSFRGQAFNYPWKFHLSCVFPSSALVPLVLSKFLVEHNTSQFRLLILMATCWIEVAWFSTVLNFSEDNAHWCPILKDLAIDVSVGSMLKCLLVLHLTLAAQRHELCRQEFSSSVCQAVEWVTQVSTTKVYQHCWKEWAG